MQIGWKCAHFHWKCGKMRMHFLRKTLPSRVTFITLLYCLPNWLLQDLLIWFLHCVHKLLLSKPYELILSLCTQLTPFKIIWPNFVIVDTIDSFQDHLTWCLYCVPKSLISKHMTPFKTIWPDFCVVYPIDSFQDHLTWFYNCVPNWLLSRPFDLIL